MFDPRQDTPPPEVERSKMRHPRGAGRLTKGKLRVRHYKTGKPNERSRIRPPQFGQSIGENNVWSPSTDTGHRDVADTVSCERCVRAGGRGLATVRLSR